MISATQQAALREAGCEVDFSNLVRQLYATDASVYQIVPEAVAFPRTAAEAAGLIRAAADAKIAVTPRGAGSGLNGGAVGDGLIIDFARHNRRITELNLEKQTVRVGAGVVLDQLNDFLQPHGFRFGPDVATSTRATLGGMIANNSSGSHVSKYGTTGDHLLALEIVTAEGKVERVGHGYEALGFQRRLIEQLVQTHRADIDAWMPPGLLKRWPGYGFDRCLRHPGHPLTHVLCGSEGTLAAIFSAELKIVPLPREKGVGLLFFASVAEAMQATVALLDLKPAAIEHIDRVLFEQTRGQLAFAAARELLDLDRQPCEAILIVEFFEDVEARLAALAQRKLGLRQLLLREPAKMNLVWALRKAGLSLLTGCKGAAKPVTCIEDTAVRPEQLPAYVAALQGLLKRLDLRACFYGHAATGLLHVRPVLDLHSAADLRKFRQLSDEVSALVREFKGSLTAEHGVGIARTEYMPAQLGPRLYEAHRVVKNAFDPANVFNPGKILGDGRYRLDTRLRQGADCRLELPFAPTLAYASRDESFVANLEQCNGCGGCLKQAPVMCPTYIATGDELMSTRGRANLIRAALEGRGTHQGDRLLSKEFEAALGNCLSCKACATECPSNVNVALLKADIVYVRHQRQGMPLRARVFSSADVLGQLGCLMPSVANALIGWAPMKQLMRSVLGIAPNRTLPKYASERFDHWFHARPVKKISRRGPVILWDDTFARYHEPNIAQAAVAVLEAAGFEVQLLKDRVCCGRPAFSQGHLDRARELGRHNLELLAAVPPDLPVIFLEPSCWAMFAEDYRELGLPGAEAAARRCFLFEQFVDALLEREPAALPLSARAHLAQLAIHNHCHAKALANLACTRRLAQRIPNARVTVMNTACCGMAGAFGMLESKYELSLKVGEPLAKQIEALPAGATVVAAGTSCRQQIQHLSKLVPKHPAEIIAEALTGCGK